MLSEKIEILKYVEEASKNERRSVTYEEVLTKCNVRKSLSGHTLVSNFECVSELLEGKYLHSDRAFPNPSCLLSVLPKGREAVEEEDRRISERKSDVRRSWLLALLSAAFGALFSEPLWNTVIPWITERL